jgi:hypothetical protein
VNLEDAKGRTKQWQNEKGQKTKKTMRSTPQKTKARETRTSLKTGGELMCSLRVSSSCLTRGTRRTTLFTYTVLMKKGLHCDYRR